MGCELTVCRGVFEEEIVVEGEGVEEMKAVPGNGIARGLVQWECIFPHTWI